MGRLDLPDPIRDEDIYPMQTSLPYGGPKLPLVLAALSSRERDILEMICDGRTNGEIADELGTNVNVISVTATRLFVKLQARNRAHAAALAVRGGIIATA